MGVVLGNSPGERVLLYAADGTTPVLVQADSSGRLIVVGSGAAGEVEVVQATPADLQATVTPAAGASFTVAQATPDNLRAGIYGRIASAWQRQPLQFGYGGVVEEIVSNLNAAAGTNVLTSTAVPANRVHVITHVSLNNRNTAGTTGSIEAVAGGEFVGIGFVITLTTADRRYGLNCNLVLEAGETMRGIIFGCTAGDDIYFALRGYYFDLNL